MTSLSAKPAFNLKVVVQETGVKPDTLRAWERRYGLPKPDRTSGGHRLYSQYDIDVIKWLTDRQHEGLSISRAVELWRTLEGQGENPLTSRAYAGPSEPEVIQPTGAVIEDAREAWVTACLNFDEATADRVLAQAFAVFPTELVCIELLQNGLASIGRLWYENKASVQQEHFASALAIRRLHALLSAAPKPSMSGRIIVACAPGEDHTFSPLLLSLLLRHKGWDVVYLGANVPTTLMDVTISKTSPDLIVLSAQQLHTAANLLATVKFLQKVGKPIAVGGRIFTRAGDLLDRIPAHYLGNSMQEALPRADDLMRYPSPNPEAEPVPERFQKAKLNYLQQQSGIEAEIRRMIQDNELVLRYLDMINGHMSRAMAAAMALGDINLLDGEIDWLRGLLSHYEVSADNLVAYLHVYRQAAADRLAPSTLLVGWLSRAEQSVAT